MGDAGGPGTTANWRGAGSDPGGGTGAGAISAPYWGLVAPRLNSGLPPSRTFDAVNHALRKSSDATGAGEGGDDGAGAFGGRSEHVARFALHGMYENPPGVLFVPLIQSDGGRSLKMRTATCVHTPTSKVDVDTSGVIVPASALDAVTVIVNGPYGPIADTEMSNPVVS
eukprot:Amastigsp_a676780_96.p3 type:complete len:169 gc:universal Amastigsp_a676780_96:1396-1902(+)